MCVAELTSDIFCHDRVKIALIVSFAYLVSISTPADMYMLRRIFNINWKDKITNKELWNMAEQDSMETTITRRKWTWIGHTMRKAGSSITKNALRWTPQGCRDRGRPKNTWKRTVEKELGNMKLSWSEAESKAQDRAEWRSIVGGLCSGRS